MPAPASLAREHEAELLRRLAEGDRTAFEQLLTGHQAAVFRYARTLTRTKEDAEDITQETFLALYRAGAALRGEAGVRTWLFTVARNSAWHKRQAQQRLPESETPLEELAVAAGWSAESPERIAQLAQDRGRLERALASLPPEERGVIVLRELEGFSGEETARLTGVTVAAMKSRLHRGRLRLAAALRAEGGR
ncbi:MAG: sigma-70 family RNA polymerase sigma factor [Bryobacter sp.]|jgi:RNA polymerase sigma-70 factor (ECF subfamily)|nr:sigma-70 family RNA polymerase sigma factor [Bryobacter sp.]